VYVHTQTHITQNTVRSKFKIHLYLPKFMMINKNVEHLFIFDYKKQSSFSGPSEKSILIIVIRDHCELIAHCNSHRKGQITLFIYSATLCVIVG